MNSLQNIFSRLLIFIIVFLSISCKKVDGINDQNEEVHAVSFKFSGFTNQISPLLGASKNNTKLATTDNNQNYSEGYLYYWSFNNDNLLPDIKFNNQLIPSISYNNGEIPNTFVNSTYSFENFAAGRALTFAGAKEIIIKMPIKDVLEVTSLGFDLGSPGTGPKDFELYYSIDNGLSYSTLAFNNQFGNTNTANQKNTYSYDLRDIDFGTEEFWVKLIPKAGDRGNSSTFNENSGVLRMDNFHLTGIAPVSQGSNAIDKIYYFLFNMDKADVVISGVSEMNGDDVLDLAIPVGAYQVCFITNTSNTELLFPANPTLASFYVSNLFSNSKADIFGYTGELVVAAVQSENIELTRFFSQVKIEFTDVRGLDQVTKIVIDQQHDPFFYAPFNNELANPILDQSSIESIADFSANKQLVFNQFLGIKNDIVPLSYVVQVYNKDGILRTINLSSTLKNNMQLVFRGNLLDGVDYNNSFSIFKNEVWDGEQTTDF